MPHNVPHLTLQDLAEHLNGVGADALIPLQAGDLGWIDVPAPNQGVLRDAFFLHFVTL